MKTLEKEWQFLVKKTYNFVFETEYPFSSRIRNMINQSYKVFLMDLDFFSSFSSNLIHIIYKYNNWCKI